MSSLQGRSWKTATSGSRRAIAATILVLLLGSVNRLHAGVELVEGGMDGDPPSVVSPPEPSPIPVTLPDSKGGEVCGIVGSTDILFANGFESGAPALLVLRTTRSVKQGPSGATIPTISIVYPSSGQTVAGSSTAVTGTFSGPADTGIVVNGVLALTSGNAFLVPSVPLSAGANTLQAKAMTLQGQSAQASVGVTQSGAPSSVTFSSTSTSGFAPFLTTFSPVVKGGITISQMKVDYDGDGVDDIVTSNPSAVLTHRYTAAGLYVARLTVVDNTAVPAPISYVAYKRVLAQDNVEARETLCSVYSYLRSSLAAANVSDAVLAFDADRRDHYQALFGSISAANLPVAAARLGTIANGVISTEFAELKVVKTFQGTTASFPMNFSRDDDGVWRIDSM